jgi:hypothetical protein
VSTSCKSAISAQINRHAKAALGLELVDLPSAVRQVPHINPSIVRGACEVVAITAESNSPDLSSLVLILDPSFLDPLSRFRYHPCSCYAAKPDGSCVAPVAGGYDVVTARLVYASYALYQSIVRGGRGEYIYGRRACAGEDLGGCNSDREDVSDACCFILACCGWRGS